MNAKQAKLCVLYCVKQSLCLVLVMKDSFCLPANCHGISSETQCQAAQVSNMTSNSQKTNISAYYFTLTYNALDNSKPQR